MRNTSRIIINTAAQYLRTIVNLILSLFSTRLILHALGVNDYGIFTLIVGVVSMLAFMTNAMVLTTQRFMSYHQAKSSLETQKKIFGDSIILHLLFSILVLLLLEIVGFFLFDGFLNINHERIYAAKILYQCTIVMILCSFITAPFKALLISHENLVYTSIIDVLDGLLKVAVAYILIALDHDKLVLYGYLMIGVYLINFFAFLIYDFRTYNECVMPKLKNFDKTYLKEMSLYVGWQLYTTGCVIGRTQGTAIVLNKFFGTVINAAFGIALQVSGAISFISSALITAINPQIMKAEGSGDRNKMFMLAEAASKFSFLLLAMLAVPITFILPEILELWLGEVPAYSVLFCRVILYTALFDQVTYGLNSANQAIGNVGPYALTINTIKIITVPVLWLMLLIGVKLKLAIWIYAVLEMVCALARLFFLKYSGGLNIQVFAKNVFGRLIMPLTFIILGYILLHQLTASLIIYILMAILISICYCMLIYHFSLNIKEKEIIKNILYKTKRFKSRY